MTSFVICQELPLDIRCVIHRIRVSSRWLLRTPLAERNEQSAPRATQELMAAYFYFGNFAGSGLSSPLPNLPLTYSCASCAPCLALVEMVSMPSTTVSLKA